MNIGALAWGLLLLPVQEPPKRPMEWGDFPVFVWRQEREKQPLDARLKASFGATNLGRDENAATLVADQLAFYVDNAAGRDELHLDRDDAYEKRFQRWYSSRDDALLVRQPCLNDPEIRARLAATLSRTLERYGEHPGLGLSLGDEVSFTPYGSPDDSCLCEHCEIHWREFLRRTVLAGSCSLPLDFTLARGSTDAARLALETGESQPIEAWLTRRAFTQASMQTRLAELALIARNSQPSAHLGLLGGIGRSAFGGVAIERVLPLLDFIECYRVGDARELMFTLRGDDQRVVQTIFFDELDRAAPAWFAWESWMRGADGLVIWSDRDLARAPRYLETLERSVGQIRTVRERAPWYRPAPRGVAVVNDGNSIAFGWLVDAALDGPTWPHRRQGWQEQHGSRERSLRAWLRLLEDCGAMPGALPLERVGAETVARFPVLVLNHLRVLDAPGMERLEAFLSASGKLLVRGELGRIDRFGRAPLNPPLEELQRRHPDSIFEFGAELDGYPAERLGGGAGLRERATKILRHDPKSLAPWRMQVDGACWPWIRSWSQSADGSLLCVSLPNFAPAELDRDLGSQTSPTREDQERGLSAIAVVPEGFEVHWLHPPNASGLQCNLPCGEPAVFLLQARPSK